jgi:hypothetical protein
MDWSHSENSAKGRTVSFSQTSFHPGDPVLLFPGVERARPHSRKRWILWPAFAYRVLAPSVRTRHLNVLQRALLGLCSAGIVEPDKASNLLCVDEELVSVVLRDIMDLGWLGKSGLLTDKGRIQLAEDRDDVGQTVAGWVFQDPWTAALWPRFIEHPIEVSVELDDRPGAMLLLGTAGRPRHERAFVILPKPGETMARMPSATEVLDASRRHRRAVRNWSDRNTTFNSEDPEHGVAVDGDPAYEAAELGRVTLIDETPERVLLATRIFRSDELGKSTLWQAWDPFGLGPSPMLRRSIEQRLAALPSLRTFLERFSSEPGPAGLQDDVEEGGSALSEAIRLVDRRVPPALRHGPVGDILLGAVRALCEAEQLGDGCPPYKLASIIVEAQRCCERLFRTIAEGFPADRAWSVLSNDRAYNEDLLNGLAASLGFSTPLPQRLLRTQIGKVRAAAAGELASLRAYMVAGLLTARVQGEHPLRHAAKDCPSLLARMEALATIRDTAAAHDSDRTLTIQDARAQIDTLFDAIVLLLGHPNAAANDGKAIEVE